MKLSGWIGIVVVAAFWIALIVWFATSQQIVLPLIADGETAPALTVKDSSGNPVHLSDFKGKVVLLDFWATWYKPCDDNMPNLNAIAKSYSSKGVVFLAVDIWDKKVVFEDWSARHGQFPSLHLAYDPRKEGKDIASTRYKVAVIPTQFVIDRNGTIVAHFVNGSQAQITTGLDNALAAP